MKQFLFLFTLLFAASAFAQGPDFNHYTPLKCAGTIPEDFRTLSQDKFRQDVKDEAKTSKNHTVSSSKQQFLLETNYLVDQLLLSGKVLFGDTVTNYVNTVADHVLANQPELRSKLRFYCLRSSEANAFSTDQGIVFITLGLIAQLENEAQLAFVISHEVAHYERHHTMNEYLRNEQIFSDNRAYKYNTYDDQIRAASSYSKELELEADSLGLVRLSKTGYNCDAAISSLFVLQFSDLPFEDYEFNAKFLESPDMVLPQDLFLDSIRPINLESDKDDDSYSTHPNIATRRNRLETMLAGMTGCGSLDYAESKNAFAIVRKICRFETVRIFLNRRDYVQAFYNTYVLQQEDPGSYYLHLCMAKCLYAMAKYKNHGQFSDVTEYYGKKEGNQQQCYYLFYKLTAPQLNMVALRYLYNFSQEDSSYFVRSMRDDLAEEAVHMNNIHISDIKKTYAVFLEMKNAPKDTVKATTAPKEENQQEGDSKAFVSKYDKLRTEKKKQEQQQVTESKKSDASKFYLLSFADIVDKADVIKMFQDAEDRAAEKDREEKAEQEKKEHMSSYEYRKQQQQKETEARRKGLALGIDTVVFVDPFYFMADDRQGLKLIRSETEQLEFCGQIRENALYSGLSIDLLNPKSFDPGDVDKYNDMALVNDWIGERLDHDDELEIMPLETDRMLPLTQKYHTTHFCYTGVYNYKKRRDDRGFIIMYSIICYPLLPFGIAYALSPEYHTYYYTLMYDVTTGKTDVNRVVHLKSKSKKGYINSIMYDTMVQIKSKKKTRKTR